MRAENITMSVLHLFVVVLLFLSLSLPTLAQQEKSKELRGYSYPKPKTRFYLANVSATYYWTSKPVPDVFFGTPRDIRASPEDRRPYVHPRIMAGPEEWAATLKRYANPRHFNVPGTWSTNYLRLTRGNGPESKVIAHLAELESSEKTAPFTGQHSGQFNSEAEFEKYKSSLAGLAREVEASGEMSSHNLFLCAFWASVAEQQGDDASFPIEETNRKCINAMLAWSKVLMAHRTVHCNPNCTVKDDVAGRRSYLWNTELPWAVSNDWYTNGASLGLAYDVLYGKLSDDERTTIRSALALLVMNRYSWGTTLTSDRRSPNAKIHPHRMFSNWGPYHANLYLANLAIEGETGFVPYVEAVLKANKATGFNKGFSERFEAVLSAFFVHSIYPDGGTFEDGYTYHTALREGSLGLVAYQRRGGRIIDTARFRNMVMNVVQMWEPWPCGHLVGHASGGGLGYPTYVGLLRYAYPDGALPKLAWAKRFGRSMDNGKCRILWSQTQHMMALFGGEHDEPAEDVIDSPHKLPPSLRKLFPLAYVSPRRGLIILHGSDRPDAAYLHLDARPDSFFLGHDNADRGNLAFMAMRKRWLVDHAWNENVDSRKHSLFHIDGLSQAMKAPSVTILRVTDDDVGAAASVDLTYTSNVWWAPAWQSPTGGSGNIPEYSADGKTAKTATYLMMDPDTNSPWNLGWPMEDDAKDIGFFRGMKLQGYENINFAGLNEWRRPLRTQYLSYYVRSVGMVRGSASSTSAPAPGFAFIVDAAGFPVGRHVFESYLQLDDAVEVEASESSCNRNTCKIVLKSTMAPEGSLDGYEDHESVSRHEDTRLTLYANSIHNDVDFRVEAYDGEAPHKRLVLRASRATAHEQLWVALLPHTKGDERGFAMARQTDGAVQFNYDGTEHTFRVDRTTHVLVRDDAAPHVPRPVPDLTVREGGIRPTTSTPEVDGESTISPDPTSSQPTTTETEEDSMTPTPTSTTEEGNEEDENEAEEEPEASGSPVPTTTSTTTTDENEAEEEPEASGSPVPTTTPTTTTTTETASTSASPSTAGEDEIDALPSESAIESISASTEEDVTDIDNDEDITEDEQDGEDVVNEENGENVVDEENGEGVVDEENGEDAVDEENGEDAVDEENGEDVVDDENGEDVVDDENGEDVVDDENGEDVIDEENGEDVVKQNGEGSVDEENGEDVVDEVNEESSSDEATESGGRQEL